MDGDTWVSERYFRILNFDVKYSHTRQMNTSTTSTTTSTQIRLYQKGFSSPLEKNQSDSPKIEPFSSDFALKEDLKSD